MESNKQVTLAQRNYFAPGTYMHKFREEFTYAGVANIITMTLLAPLERWRIIAQTQKAYPLRPKKFKHFFDYITSRHIDDTGIPKEQGLLSLWRGNGANIWIYLYQAIFQIGLYDTIKADSSQFSKQLFETPSVIPIFEDFIFPLMISITTLGVIHPLDTYRVHLNMSYHKDKADALFTKFRHRRQQVGGIRSLYQGFILANIIALINFNFYKHLYDAVGKVEIEGVPADLFNKDMALSVLAVGLVHPLDTLKKIFQLNNMHKPKIFDGYRSVAKFLTQNKLNSSLFNGLTASLTRTALFTPIYWQVLKYWRQSIDSPSTARTLA